MSEARKKINQKDFSVWESHLPTILGVPRERLNDLRCRMLEENVDWIKNGRRILWTPEAVEVVREAIGLPVSNGHEKQQGGHIAKQEFTFTVFRVDIPNPRILLVTDGKEVFKLRVKAKVNFLRGMEVKCYHEQGDVFTLAGNCPRYRGKY